MVEITKIENQKNKEKYNLFVDGEFYSGVLKEVAIANNFFVGKKIAKNSLDQILIVSEGKQAFKKASDLLATRLHSKNELRQKLIAKGYSINAIRWALEKLIEYNYINDYQFAKSFVEQNNKLSKQMITSKLINKGISKEIINGVLQDIDNTTEVNNAKLIIEKYLKNKDFNTCKQKLFAHMYRKGFSVDIINKAIKIVTKTDVEWED